MPIVLFPASTKNVFEILAVMPELLAISKKASGVTSPNPNLPKETVENLANGVEAVFLTTKSLSKSQPPETVSSCDKEAGPPAPQSNLTITSAESEALKAKWPGSKDIVATEVSSKRPNSLNSIEPPPPPAGAAVQPNLPELL